MALLETWRKLAYETEMDQKQAADFWNSYFIQEKGIYEKILAANEEPVSGTVKELADRFGVEVLMMTGFLDGINDSLKKANPIETMEEDTPVSLDYDKEKLYYNNDTFDIDITPADIVPENFNSAEAMWDMIQRLQEL